MVVGGQEQDHEILKTLDFKVNEKYRVVVATDKGAMRGIDYRAPSCKMTLVLAKSFEN